MVKKFIYPNHIDEQGLPKVQYIHVQSSVGENQKIDFNKWGLLIRYQLILISRKIHKLEKENNYKLFKR
jgi:hypothetical protein